MPYWACMNLTRPLSEIPFSTQVPGDFFPIYHRHLGDLKSVQFCNCHTHFSPQRLLWVTERWMKQAKILLPWGKVPFNWFSLFPWRSLDSIFVNNDVFTRSGCRLCATCVAWTSKLLTKHNVKQEHINGIDVWTTLFLLLLFSTYCTCGGYFSLLHVQSSAWLGACFQTRKKCTN